MSEVKTYVTVNEDGKIIREVVITGEQDADDIAVVTWGGVPCVLTPKEKR